VSHLGPDPVIGVLKRILLGSARPQCLALRSECCGSRLLERWDAGEGEATGDQSQSQPSTGQKDGGASS